MVSPKKAKEKTKMLKKTIKYTDYNGVEQTEDFYFNLSKAELAEMELEIDGGLTNYIDKIIAAKKTPEIVKVFKDLILRSYGVKSPDGKRFIKSKEQSDAFAQTEAYSNLFIELASNADAASEFINGIVPAAVANAVAEKKE
jgi:hypothetical protein